MAKKKQQQGKPDYRFVLAEDVLPIAEAAREVPSASGKGVSPSTIYRWIHRGIDGVHLPAIRMGSRWYTSRQRLSQFIQDTTSVVV